MTSRPRALIVLHAALLTPCLLTPCLLTPCLLTPCLLTLCLLTLCLLTLCLLTLSTCGSSGAEAEAGSKDDGWSFVSGDGKTYTLDQKPTRIIAHAYAAAALMEFGIKPVAIYADGPVKDDVGLTGLPQMMST